MADDPNLPSVYAAPPPIRGPFPVRHVACGWCHLVYDELIQSPSPPLADGQVGRCPRCGQHDRQDQIGRGEA
jgi:hypothetical protein